MWIRAIAITNRNGAHRDPHLKRKGVVAAASFREKRFPPRRKTCRESERRHSGSRRERTILDEVQARSSSARDFEFNGLVVAFNHSTRFGRQKSCAYPDRGLSTSFPNAEKWNRRMLEERFRANEDSTRSRLDSDGPIYQRRRLLAGWLRNLKSDLMRWSSAPIRWSFLWKEVPPGLIDHREWTRENGRRNNALAFNGLGAPRAFNKSVLRRIGFPNVAMARTTR